MRIIWSALGFVLLAGVASSGPAARNASGECFVYIGTYTDRSEPGPPSRGIYLYRMPAASGRLTPAGQQIEVGSPTFIKFVPAH